MKRSLLTGAMVFIGSICTNVTIAQVHEYEGHGMSTIKAQRETNPEIIKSNCKKVIFGTTSEAFTVIRSDLKHVTQQQILDAIVQNIADQMDEDFLPNHPDEYSIEWVTYKTNSEEWKKFCAENEDSYVKDQVGELKFDYGDPASSWVSRHKTCRIVAVITHVTTGKTARIFADCLNGFRPLDETITKRDVDRGPGVVTPNYRGDNSNCFIESFTASRLKIRRGRSVTLNWEATCSPLTLKESNSLEADAVRQLIRKNLPAVSGNGLSVTPMDRINYYMLTTPEGTGKYVKIKAKTFVGENWAWIGPLGAGVIATGTVLLVDALKKGPVVVDNTYPNNFQGGSGPSGTSGGTGSQKTTSVPPPMVGTQSVPSIPVVSTMRPPVVTVRYIIHF